MHLVCLDLEGVLVPEIWITFSELVGIPEFSRTTRDEPDYNKLMLYRMDLLSKHNLKLVDIQRAIGIMEPLPGAFEFLKELREKTQVIILSDTFQEFAWPLMAKLSYPTLFCNQIKTDLSGAVSSYVLRQESGKKSSVAAFKSLNYLVFAAGDSFNDLEMLREADSGCLFRAPPAIKNAYKEFDSTDSFTELGKKIDLFLADNFS